MNVLIACEFSGVVRDAFKSTGADVISCDLLPTERPGKHYTGHVEDILSNYYDLIIAHPPCTYLCNSGIRWLHTQPGRFGKLIEAAEFFKLFLNHPCKKICVENPIPHRYATELIGQKYNQIINPYQFGHPERKATCLWLKGLPNLTETENVMEEMKKLTKRESQKIHHMPPGGNRKKLRSITYRGIAQAMANQWVDL